MPPLYKYHLTCGDNNLLVNSSRINHPDTIKVLKVFYSYFERMGATVEIKTEGLPAEREDEFRRLLSYTED